MGKRYIVEDVRATGWSMRLRDTKTGETYEVPIAPGARFMPPNGPRDEETATSSPGAVTSSDDTASTLQDAITDKTSPTAEKRTKRKTNKRKTSHGDTKHPKQPRESAPNPLETNEGRMQPIDERTLTADDHAVLEKRQTMFRRLAGLHEGKRGGLGWQETTDAGRSGLRARFHAGAFKILHAGGDTYALFYEWDSGRYERIGCGAAPDLMDIAAKRAEQGLPSPPRTILDLELARFYCGNTEQRKTAEERLAPVFREVEHKPEVDLMSEPTRDPEPKETPTRPRRPRRVTPTTPDPTTSTSSPSTELPIDPKLDETLTATLLQALSKLEAQ